MTVTEEMLENQDSSENGTPESTETTEPTVKYPTYVELAKATWKLAFALSTRGEDEDVSRDHCVDGTSSFLERLELPRLGDVRSLEQADRYLDAWLGFTHYREAGELSPEDDVWLRNRLVTRLRETLRSAEPASRDVMSRWLVELGVEPFAPPAPRRHTGAYHVSYNATTEVNSARIAEALRREFPNLSVQVTYTGRVA